MEKLFLTPDNSSYDVSRNPEVLAVQLDGGASKMRRDILGASFLVNVVWILNPTQYNYINAFYRTSVAHGSVPFNIDLILDNITLTQYVVRFIPNSFKLTSQRGLAYTVSATLEVESVADNATADNVIIDAYEASL